MKENNDIRIYNSVLDNFKTLDEVLEAPAIKNIKKFIKTKEFKEFDKSGLVPHYLINNRKAYKTKEVKEWICQQLIKKFGGTKVISNFCVIQNNGEISTNIPMELNEHSGDIYEYDTHLPTCVYFLIDKTEIVYVGKSTNLATRIQQHKNAKEFDRVLYLPIEENRLDVIERYFIETLEPKYNQEGFMVNGSYRYKSLGYKLLNKILYKENSSGLLDKII